MRVAPFTRLPLTNRPVCLRAAFKEFVQLRDRVLVASGMPPRDKSLYADQLKEREAAKAAAAAAAAGAAAPADSAAAASATAATDASAGAAAEAKPKAEGAPAS